jgi:hypothetical protein
VGATLSTLRAEVNFRIAREGESGIDARIDTRINWAARRIAQIVELSELEQSFSRTLTTSSTIALPTDLFFIKSLFISEDRQPIWLRSIRDNEVVDRSDTGEPRTAFRQGYTLDLRPTPSSTYLATTKTMIGLYQARPITITSSVDSPLPDEMDEVLVLGASYRMLRDLNDVERAEKANRDFMGELRAFGDQKGQEVKWMRAVQFNYLT